MVKARILSHSLVAKQCRSMHNAWQCNVWACDCSEAPQTVLLVCTLLFFCAYLYIAYSWDSSSIKRCGLAFVQSSCLFFREKVSQLYYKNKAYKSVTRVKQISLKALHVPIWETWWTQSSCLLFSLLSDVIPSQDSGCLSVMFVFGSAVLVVPHTASEFCLYSQ